jgi:hypothetical protein
MLLLYVLFIKIELIKGGIKMADCECLPGCPFFNDRMQNMPAVSAGRRGPPRYEDARFVFYSEEMTVYEAMMYY